MNAEISKMTPTADPSIFEFEGQLYHVPRSAGWKSAYLAAGILVFLLGLWFLWEPVGRLVFGTTSEARLSRIVKVIPGADPQTIRYRREFPDERDRSITFQHYVEVQSNGETKTLRLGVDSRVKPYANINDRITVIHRPGDSFAFQKWEARTFGIGLLYCVIGSVFLGMGIPMLLAVGKPILIDPEANEHPHGPPTDKSA